jgi:hypothetical protein
MENTNTGNTHDAAKFGERQFSLQGANATQNKFVYMK